MARRPVNPPAQGWKPDAARPRLWADPVRAPLRHDDQEHGAYPAGPPRGRPTGDPACWPASSSWLPTAGTTCPASAGAGCSASRLRAGRRGPGPRREAGLHRRPQPLRAGDQVGFLPGSTWPSHRDAGYPALRQLTGQIVGGLVLTPHAAAGGPVGSPTATRAGPRRGESSRPGEPGCGCAPSPAADEARRPAPGPPGTPPRRPGPGDPPSAPARGRRRTRRCRQHHRRNSARLGMGALVLIDDDTVDNTRTFPGSSEQSPKTPTGPRPRSPRATPAARTRTSATTLIARACGASRVAEAGPVPAATGSSWPPTVTPPATG